MNKIDKFIAKHNKRPQALADTSFPKCYQTCTIAIKFGVSECKYICSNKFKEEK